MKEYAIFDMDGLLVDTERVYQSIWKEVALELGLTPSPTFPQEICGTSGETGLAVIRRHYPTVDPVLYHDMVHQRTMQRLEEHVDLKPGAAALVEYLYRKGVKLAVASSSSFKTIQHHLGLTGLLDKFDHLVSGQQVQHSKPAPDIFLLAAEKLGAAPEDCYVFEDGVNGGWAGVRAGCVTVLVPDFVPIPQELASAAAAVLPSLEIVQQEIEAGRL